jgi:hypothetical protein
MPTPLDPAALEAEFRILVARAGVTVPQDRMASILTGYADFRGQLELLRGGRDHTSEMGNIFRMPTPEHT